MLIWPTVHLVDILTQEVATFTFHRHLPVCHLCSQRSFFFSLCDRDFSSTAECRLSLHMNQLLYKRQLHAGAAYKPLPFLNKTLWDLKEKIKDINLHFPGLGGGVVVRFVVGFFPLLKRQNQLEVIKTSTSFLYGHTCTGFGSFRCCI